MTPKSDKSIVLFTILTVVLLGVFLLWLFWGTAEPAALPAATQRFFVNDFAEILTEEDENAVYEAGGNLQNATTAQVVLVTVQDTGDRDLETFSLELAREWGIGQQGEDNGILLLFTVDGPHSRIEVGYGLEGAMNDSKAGRILDTWLVPHYGDSAAWSGALRDTYIAILNVVYEEYGLTEQKLPLAEPEGYDAEEDASAMIVLLVVLLCVAVVLTSKRGGGRWVFLGGGGHHGGFGGGGFGGGGGGFHGGGGGFGGGGASR